MVQNIAFICLLVWESSPSPSDTVPAVDCESSFYLSPSGSPNCQISLNGNYCWSLQLNQTSLSSLSLEKRHVQRHNKSRLRPVYCNYTADINILRTSRLTQYRHKRSQTLIKQLLCRWTMCVGCEYSMCHFHHLKSEECVAPTFFGDLPQFKSYCEGLGYCQSHCLSLENSRKIHTVTDQCFKTQKINVHQ